MKKGVLLKDCKEKFAYITISSSRVWKGLGVISWVFHDICRSPCKVLYVMKDLIYALELEIAWTEV